MASYKIISTNSTLGAVGTLVSDEDIAAASCTADQLVEHGVIETPTKTPTTKQEKE